MRAGVAAADMEACLAETDAFAHDDPGIGVIASIARALLALCEDDRSGASLLPRRWRPDGSRSRTLGAAPCGPAR